VACGPHIRLPVFPGCAHTRSSHATRIGSTTAPALPESADDAAGAGRDESDAQLEGEAAAGSAEKAVQDGGGGGGGGVGRGADERLVDATARLSLGAESDEVQEVANGVVSVTDGHRGVVLNSQVTSDQAGARAAFTLEIPFKELDAALTDLSELGDVISRTEQGEDITQAAVRAQRRVARTHERIRELRIDLIEAETRDERLVIKARIDSLEAQANAFEAQRNNVERRARFATVNVEITSNGPETDDGDWSLGDAVDDAGDVLTVLGGIALITLAIVVPLGLVIALILWITLRTQRTRRERALDA
jgi:hypothetical protein